MHGSLMNFSLVLVQLGCNWLLIGRQKQSLFLLALWEVEYWILADVLAPGNAHYEPFTEHARPQVNRFNRSRCR